jgi:hypothetical protein
MQNLHLPHPEDSILTGDLEVLDWFTEPAYVSVKIDGCPAIVWGTDPATGTFFVGTKAVFNKKKIRIAHNHEEIDEHYVGEVADILHACYDSLPRTDSIYQGDFIGFGGDSTYHPQAVSYVFPEIITQSIIIAPHTMYEANDDLRDSWALPLLAQLESTSEVMFVQPEAWEDDKSFDSIVKFARQMATMCEFAKNKTHARKIEKVINTFIKIGAVLDAEALALAADCDINLIRLWQLVKMIKEDRLSQCATMGGPLAYIGKRFIAAEGYVLSNEYGSYKLVKREVFSRHNFNFGKFACAS